ncbi:uncharacterized protein N7483_006405 [Penicillium malachiteum]|uniref:uncharacterized protein n=1 Tax=Penicillium malachiteum TaxID=1324776 RepID=UPI0025477B06|nr:uncharacterized protein N7483_006405 [Penicillium malachiteum]KAJ5725048.1 hypothetical protein N7483_006405 [Penicillium malachiteum]
MTPQIRITYRPNSTPLPYTASPFKLLWSDICLALRYAWALPFAFLPLRIGRTDHLDELYPSARTGISAGSQVLLAVYQVLFLLSVPIAIILMVPGLWIFLYIVTVVTLNHVFCMVLLNGFQRLIVSQVPVPEQPSHSGERWFFINGIAGSHSWVQQNVDQLSYTFGRKITGIHNRTSGFVFDLIECVIQRCFSYATGDIRAAYPLVKNALLDPTCQKVVFILHSQGGIEGGLVIDWLLDALPHDVLQHLEVYTFANAANHFNNPTRKWLSKANGSHSCRLSEQNRSVGYIEHYANTVDIVAWIGVFHFINIPNRYMGRFFVHPGSGHLLNQHYLDPMFTLGPDHKVLENNPFMDMEVETNSQKMPEDDCEETLLPISDSQGSPDKTDDQVLRVKDFSRLWKYRNGGSPTD